MKHLCLWDWSTTWTNPHSGYIPLGLVLKGCVHKVDLSAKRICPQSGCIPTGLVLKGLVPAGLVHEVESKLVISKTHILNSQKR